MWRHFGSVALSNCPFIRPAIDRKLIACSVFHAQSSMDELEYNLFLHSSKYVEQFRLDRRGANRQDWLLRCYNVIIPAAEAYDSDVFRCVENVHWMLKCLYSSKQVVFGKFHKGHSEYSKTGVAIPAAPISFISIRSLMLDRDKQFFSKAETLWAVASHSEDDMGSVFDLDRRRHFKTDKERYLYACRVSELL